MFDRRNNRDRAIFEYLLARHLDQEKFDWLLKNRANDWADFLDNETVETMKVKSEPWTKVWLVVGIQDLLDALAKRRTRKMHGKKQIRKDPYIYELLRLLKIEGSHNRPREQLESRINQKIEELKVSKSG